MNFSQKYMGSVFFGVTLYVNMHPYIYIYIYKINLNHKLENFY